MVNRWNSPEFRGSALGLLAVGVFALNLPFTRLAAQDLSPWAIGLSRCLLASACAAWMLVLVGGQRPAREDWQGFAIVALGMVIGCLFYPFAMAHASASHGAVIAGIQPLLTALFAVWRNGERPSAWFWGWAALGSLILLVFVAQHGVGGDLGFADLAMLGAVGFCSLSYAEGGRLAKRYGGFRTICWGLALPGPLLILPAAGVLMHSAGAAPDSGVAWACVAYIALIGLLLGMIPWYAAMALSGAARIGQLQLLQPFMTLLAAMWLLGEAVPPGFWVFSGLLTACVGLGRYAPGAWFSKKGVS